MSCRFCRDSFDVSVEATNSIHTETDMRFMVIVKASNESEGGQGPDTKSLMEMTKYNEELAKAGVMLAGEGLQPSSKGSRVKFSGSKRTITDGPFAEAKELVA